MNTVVDIFQRRERLSTELQIVRSQHFYSPYSHAVGTLYQAAFGRDRSGGQARRLNGLLNKRLYKMRARRADVAD